MLKTFSDYMYYLLSFPFKIAKKEHNQWFIYFDVLGKYLDQNMEALKVARSESTLVACSNSILQEHGRDRGLIRYEGESYENFRKRNMLYGEICKRGGTAYGTKLAVEALGFKNVENLPCYIFDNNQSRWAEFYIVITRDVDDLFDIDHDIIRREVRQIKKVSAKDNYLFRFLIPPIVNVNYSEMYRLTMRCEAHWYSNGTFNGFYLNNGAIGHSNVIANHPTAFTFRVSAASKEEFIVRCINYHNWRTNDGATYNDGSKCFDACVIEEDI